MGTFSCKLSCPFMSQEIVWTELFTWVRTNIWPPKSWSSKSKAPKKVHLNAFGQHKSKLAKKRSPMEKGALLISPSTRRSIMRRSWNMIAKFWTSKKSWSIYQKGALLLESTPFRSASHCLQTSPRACTSKIRKCGRIRKPKWSTISRRSWSAKKTTKRWSTSSC